MKIRCLPFKAEKFHSIILFEKLETTSLFFSNLIKIDIEYNNIIILFFEMRALRRYGRKFINSIIKIGTFKINIKKQYYLFTHNNKMVLFKKNQRK